ncbi:MAG: N-acetylmuramic acid 6-phosphate etherase [Nitrospirae bacterium]|nr:N-acetylmuramic acid 6-phosphate etherase [Nitrospirota bacterium]
MYNDDINPHSEHLDSLSADEIITRMNYDNLRVMNAINSAKGPITAAINDAVSAIQSGGSLIYVGAGTSGRLGVLDASEIPPTFGVSPEVVRAIIAGGDRAITLAVEGAEDDEDAGRKDVSGIGNRDMLLGITASGSTPYTIAALKEAKRRGSKCWLLVCNEVTLDFPDGIINLSVGPEMIGGSTRLKAGTATKIVLNMISTAAMIKLGKVYKGYMVDVIPSNRKLRKRALNIIQGITGCSSEEAEVFLEKSGENAKTAILMYMKGLNLNDAKEVLKSSEDSLRKALEG